MDLFWEIAGWETQDPNLQKLSEMPFKRPFPFIPEKPGLYVIRGPRQVGKSCWLKTILSHYCRQEKCFFLSCENVSGHKELAEILSSVRHRPIILLDEINYVDGWDKAIKHAIDSGETKLLVITGSHTFDLKRGADRMPGRFGAGGEFLLLPMGFEEFHIMRQQAGWISEDRVEELRAFFRVGGFPSAVAEGGSAALLPKKALQTYWKWLSGDIVRLGKQESYLTEIMVQIALTMQSAMSLQTLAQKTNFGSHNTAQEYVGILEACFALRSLLAVDIDTGAYRFKKNRKFYFTDPLLYWVALSLGGQKSPPDVESRLAEMVAHEELARRYNRFGYFSSRNGEIDFILPKQWAIEVKWSPVASNLSKAYLNTGLGWKNVWTQSNFLKNFPTS